MPRRIETRREMLSSEIWSIQMVNWGQWEDGRITVRLMVNGSSFKDADFILKPISGNTYNVELYWPPLPGRGSQDLGTHTVDDISENGLTAWATQILKDIVAQGGLREPI